MCLSQSLDNGLQSFEDRIDMSRLGNMLSLIPSTPICNNCASEFNSTFALGARVQSERVWLCSPACLWSLRATWTPGKPKVNRGLLSFIRNLFASEE